MTSPESSVVAAAPVIALAAGALIVSSAIVPEIVSTPVVSDQISVYEIDKYFNNLINDAISIFIVTYRIPTLAR